LSENVRVTTMRYRASKSQMTQRPSSDYPSVRPSVRL
jgi:hypothetical protein